ITHGSGIQHETVQTRVETLDPSAPPSYWEATNESNDQSRTEHKSN
ncbi:unnamed protein product, partial [Rotaria sp. Silwood2]